MFERKQRLKDALASGKALPNELKADARAMGKDLALDEAQTGELSCAGFSVEQSSSCGERWAKLTLQRCAHMSTTSMPRLALMTQKSSLRLAVILLRA